MMRLLTVAELCRALRISRTTAFRLMRDGRLPWVQVGGERRIWQSDLDAYLAAGRRVGGTSDD